MNVLATITTTLPLLLIVSIATVTDVKAQRIPNWLTFPAIVIGIVVNLLIGGAEGFVSGVLGLVIGFALLILPYIMGGMGAGDVKLLGAIGAFLGPKNVFTVFLYSAVIGGIYSLIILLRFPGKVGSKPVNTGLETIKTIALTRMPPPKVTERETVKRPQLKYGIALALGTIIFLAFEQINFNDWW